jgi:DNA-binding transcriptional LysR family regulator
LSNYTTSLDLRQLRYFLTVAEELSFRRASRRLGIASPSLSQQIKALEQELSLQLFERNHRSVALTPIGTKLLPHVRNLLVQADELRRRASGLTSAQPVRLGLVNSAPPDWAERISGVDAVTIDTWVMPSRIQANRVCAGNLDLAICHLDTTDLDSAGLEARLAGVDRLHAIDVGSQPSSARAGDIAVLVEADVTSWSSWNNYAQEFAYATGALVVHIDDGGVAGSAFFAHVRRLRRPVLNCPKGATVSLPDDMVRRPIIEPSPLWTWSLVRRRSDDSLSVGAVVEALTQGVVAPDTACGAQWLPRRDPHFPGSLT